MPWRFMGGTDLAWRPQTIRGLKDDVEHVDRGTPRTLKTPRHIALPLTTMDTVIDQYAVVTRSRAENIVTTYTVTWTNLGPLTSTFTPGTGCATPLPTNLVAQIATDQGFDYNRIEASDTPRSICYPSHEATKVATQLPANNVPAEHGYFYSPSHACPSGWHLPPLRRSECCRFFHVILYP
ncbi:uncharacterized protein MYCFIDRAFT_170182 [Pseudocercospora fijiensis CIRAD86]|uniref:Uncharacterized protein n=1 Tax=Pseudocercospora fijiensis (strain CIRAD86) TaxID=383855 RepID=N1QBL5_PSEFD|nr:uncharacterized protein MYCFIDRAFT_170182 [Pseudocercospora fijiensis CIRAD86]EME88597.1 hypothetical protein MYCFIDRAFT_170182 [Pseudocercospora fijiensis CIRAD86]